MYMLYMHWLCLFVWRSLCDLPCSAATGCLCTLQPRLRVAQNEKVFFLQFDLCASTTVLEHFCISDMQLHISLVPGITASERRSAKSNSYTKVEFGVVGGCHPWALHSKRDRLVVFQPQARVECIGFGIA